MAKWKQAAICPKCGEAAHIKICPKPRKISKKKWQKMNDDQRIEAEMEATDPYEKRR